ncbi:PadR family transcriptional regulator [Streptosporangium sp. KLBMP 9127]|nr:PadR family transcriptional regulator [Streptosporangium sp. KLBMP 9127]
MTSAHTMGWAGQDPHEIRREMRRAARGAWAAMTTAASAWQQAGPPRGGPHEHRHRGHGGHRPFPWDFGRGVFGPGFPPGGRGFGRGRKAKRGDVRAAILALLAEEPRNGYQIIQEIAERSEGGWKPSPGAVYPALQQLTDEGLVRPEESEGRKTFRLTEAGLAYVADHSEEVRAPWEEMRPDVDDSTWELMDLAKQSGFAMVQILQTGSEAQIRQARQTLVETRRKLYQILADGDPAEE